MKIGFIGCGSIGKRHLINLSTIGHANFVVCDPMQPEVKGLSRKADIQFVTNIEELTESLPDVVFICTPTAMHDQNLMQILNWGKAHVFVEKPLSHTPANFTEIKRLAAVANKTIMTGCNLRFHAGVQKTKELIDSNEIGKVLSARIYVGSYLPAWHPHEDYRKMYSASRALGGGCLLDCIHEIDYANWLFGTPKEVSAICGKFSSLEIECEDTAEIMVRYQDGPICSIHLNYWQRPVHRGCFIAGEEGSIEWDMSCPVVRCWTTKSQAWEEFRLPAGYGVNEMYVDELKYFMGSLERGEKVFSDLEEATRAVQVVEAARLSSSKKVTVTMPYKEN